jgi:hypothetical protein
MWLFDNISKNLKKTELKEEKWSNSYPIKNPSRSYKTNGFLAAEARLVIRGIAFVRKGNFAQNFFKGINEKEVLYSFVSGLILTKNKKTLLKIANYELKRNYYKKKEKEKRNLEATQNYKKINSLVVVLKKIERW